VQYTTWRRDGALRWSQVVERGRVAWKREALADADVEIRSAATVAFDLLGRYADGNTITAATTIVEQRPDGRYEGPPPPVDFVQRPELAELPVIRGADMRAVFEHPNGPFGTTYYTLVFEDGRLVDMPMRVEPEPDAAVSFPFRELMLLRQGKITPLDAAAAGRVGGSQGALALLVGLVESSAYRCAMAACSAGPGTDAFLSLAALYDAPAYRDAVAVLLADTIRPQS